MSNQNTTRNTNSLSENYQFDLRDYYDNNKNRLLGGMLAKLTERSIKDAIGYRIQGDLSDIDVSILKAFYIENQKGGKTVGMNLYSVINQTDIEKYKPFKNFLKGDTTNLSATFAADMLAFILDFKPRPYTSYVGLDEVINIKKEPKIRRIVDPTFLGNENEAPIPSVKEKTKKPFFSKEGVFIFLAIVALLIYIASAFTDFFKTPEPTIITTDNSTNITIETLNQSNYYYTKSTDGKISITEELAPDEVDLKKYKPVTRKVLYTYFSQQGQDTTAMETRNFIDAKYLQNGARIQDTSTDLKQESQVQDLVPISITEEIPIREESPQILPIVATIVPKMASNSVSFQVKNETKDELDHAVLSVFRDKYANKYVFIADNQTKTAFVCSGHTTYSYSPSPVREDMIVCDMILNYEIKNIANNKIKAGKRHVSTGTGFSEHAAKQNAIIKLKIK